MFIRPFENRDFDEVIFLHHNRFSVFGWDAEFYEKNMDDYRQFFHPSRTVVAEVDKKVVGFACYNFFDGDFFIEPDQDIYFNDCIFLDEEGRARIEKMLHRKKDEQGLSEIVIEPFPNEFSRTGYVVQPKDLEVTSMVVLPEYGNQGIGMAMGLEIYRIASEYGSSAGFASCWEGSYSPQLAKSFGVVPIVRLGPLFNDGSCGLVVGKMR